MKNSGEITLAYMSYARPPAPSSIIIEREQKIIKNSPLQGNIFSFDTKKVLDILKEITVDTDDETYTKRKRCGKEAILALQNHYYGKSEGWLRTT